MSDPRPRTSFIYSFQDLSQGLQRIWSSKVSLEIYGQGLRPRPDPYHHQCDRMRHVTWFVTYYGKASASGVVLQEGRHLTSKGYPLKICLSVQVLLSLQGKDNQYQRYLTEPEGTLSGLKGYTLSFS